MPPSYSMSGDSLPLMQPGEKIEPLKPGQKWDKSAVGYQYADDPNESCGVCKNFEPRARVEKFRALCVR
jgi:hypothetical protein